MTDGHSCQTHSLSAVPSCSLAGCHWVSGANPGGQTRLSDSPGTEMSSDANLSLRNARKEQSRFSF
uniref:Uncharacterized protein n=1 Tax=Cyprinus carpio TaxID=7962 RepID=A0A8C2HLP8_CYPCA